MKLLTFSLNYGNKKAAVYLNSTLWFTNAFMQIILVFVVTQNWWLCLNLHLSNGTDLEKSKQITTKKSRGEKLYHLGYILPEGKKNKMSALNGQYKR